MSLWSPKNKPDNPHWNPLDCPATLRDLIATEQRIVAAIATLADLTKLPTLTAQLKSHTDALQKALDANVVSSKEQQQNER